MGALTLALAVLLGSSTAQAEQRHRGWLTGAGLGLIGGGVAAATLGLGFLLTANEANALLRGYYPTAGSAPTAQEAPAVRIIESRRDGAQMAAAVSFGLGGAMVVGGIVCLVLGGRAPAVSVVPLPGGGAVSVALRW